MKTIILFILTLATLMAPPNLNGKWQAQQAEMAGKLFPAEVTKTLLLVIADGHYDLQNDHGKIRILDEEKMEITGTDGPNKDKTLKAIYKLEGDVLQICYDLSGSSFPTSFATRENSKLFLVHYSLVK